MQIYFFNVTSKYFFSWTINIKNIYSLPCAVQVAGAVTDLMDIQGSSVLLCLEDGWDLTCQVAIPALYCNVM